MVEARPVLKLENEEAQTFDLIDTEYFNYHIRSIGTSFLLVEMKPKTDCQLFIST